MLKKLVITIGVILAVPVFALSALEWRTTLARPDIKPDIGINELRRVELNGVPQWVQIRGQNRANPTLLFLHGGPGAPMMAFGHEFQDRWEAEFNVVHWDQRGSGKSYFEQSVSPPQFDEMMADAEALVRWLQAHMGVERIYLLGHSWGSVLGAPLVLAHPEWFHAFIATGAVVDIPNSERLGYEYTLHYAQSRNDAQGIRALRNLEPYPDESGSYASEKVLELRRWQTRYGFGLSRRLGEESWSALARMAALSPDYSLHEATYFLRDLSAQWEPLNAFVNAYDIRRYGSRFEVPVVFLLGRHDWQTSSELAADFFWHELEAPHKRLVWLENSAHTPYIDEPEVFARELIAVRRLAR